MFEMTPNVLRNFFSKKATRRYPKEVRSLYENARGQIINSIDKCTFCSLCVIKCPSHCITVDKKAAVWKYDLFTCVFCGICVGACTAKCLQQKLEYHPPVAVREMIVLKGEPKRKIEKKSNAPQSALHTEENNG